MGYMDEHDSLWWQNSNPYFKPEAIAKMESMRRRYEDLEALATEVKRFVDASSLLVGADRIRAVLKRLEANPK